jgi:hypothetical protein
MSALSVLLWLFFPGAMFWSLIFRSARGERPRRKPDANRRVRK